MMNKAPNKEKPIRAMPSPITMLDRFTGVAKKRLITKVLPQAKKYESRTKNAGT